MQSSWVQKMTNKNVPDIRFDGFTDDWEQRKLVDLFETACSGGTPTSSVERYYDGEIPFLGIADITGRTINETKKHISEEGLNNSTAVIIPPGTISLAMYASVGKVGITNVPMATSQAFYNMTFSSIPTRDFVYTVLEKMEIFSEWESLISTGTQRNLNAEKVKNLLIKVPSENERKQIGLFFQNLDNTITLHQRKYEKLHTIKKSLLEKMFPKEGESEPEIRFAGFTEPWEQHKLGEFGKATGGTSIESEFSEDGKYKVISIGSYSEDSVYRDQGIRAIESEKTKKRVLNKDDLTMILNDKTSSGNIIGRVLLIEESGVYVYNQRTERIEIDQNSYDALFIFEMLNAPQIRDKIVKQSQGNTQIYVNWSTIAETDYLVPQIDEQRCLGEYFSNLDNLITLHQRKLIKLKNIKKALLNKMFV